MIRKVYRDIIISKLRQEGPGWIIRRSRQYLLLQLSELAHRPLCGPALGTLMVTYRCNLHCAMCDMPLKAAASDGEQRQEFGTPRFREIIGEFARLGVPGIGFTGGEPLLRDDIFELLDCTRRHGMIAHLNTNGWLLGSDEARRIVEIGVDSVNVSLDGATAATHDRIRNKPGTFERAVNAVRLLVDQRNRTEGKVRVKTVAVIDETNLDEIPGMIRLGQELGTDCIEFIPRQPFCRASGGENQGIGNELLFRVGEMAKYIESRRGTVAIENSPPHLRLFRRSFAGLPSPVRCSAGYNSLAVDCYGDIFPCVPWINWGRAVANLGNRSLREVWESEAYQRDREASARCRDCYLNCQTEMNLLFDIASRLRI